MAVTALLSAKKCAGHIGHKKALTLSRRARAMKYVCSYEAGEVARSSVSERCLRGVSARLTGAEQTAEESAVASHAARSQSI